LSVFSNDATRSNGDVKERQRRSFCHRLRL
jgi:hypothetical protein